MAAEQKYPSPWAAPLGRVVRLSSPEAQDYDPVWLDKCRTVTYRREVREWDTSHHGFTEQALVHDGVLGEG